MGKWRDKLAFEPQWEGAIEGWARKYARRNYWRVAKIMDFEDLMQDAYVKYLQCCQKYPGVNTPQWFMRLFQTAFHNHIHTLSSKQSSMGERVETIRTEEGEHDSEYIVDNVVGEVTNSGRLAVLLDQMPEEARELVISMATDDPGKFRQERIRCELKRGLTIRETTNEYWCRIMGYDPDEVDLPTVLRTYLQDA